MRLQWLVDTTADDVGTAADYLQSDNAANDPAGLADATDDDVSAVAVAIRPPRG